MMVSYVKEAFRELSSRLINQSKIRWVVFGFCPFKAPGVDEIFPALLQQGFNMLTSPFCKLLMASVVLGYLPVRWRKKK